jgi:putative ABC transport system permease protein
MSRALGVIELRETLAMAGRALWTHRFRSALTVLGIVIGITTVVTVAALLAGVRASVVEFFQEFGPDSIFVARLSGDPSGAQAPPREFKRRPLRPADAEYLKNVVRSIDDVAVTLFFLPPAGKLMTAKVPGFESENISISGSTANLFDISPRALREGRLFTSEEARRAGKVAMLGSSLADALFPSGGGVGRSVTVDGAEYTVVGIFAQAKGGFFGENGFDRQVTLPLETVRMRYPQADNFFFTARARKGHREDAVQELGAALRRLRRVPSGADDDFSISTADSIIKNLDQITGMIILVSIALSGMGLLVGGIGVMNIMLVSVTERTREIGVRKALGARRADIVLQFLAEAVALTGIGGLVGIAFSMLVSIVLSLVLPALKPSVPLWAVAAGILMSVGTGLFFGVWPAVQASRLDPVDALRYE